MESKVFPLRLSDSSLRNLHACERFFQLEKLLVTGKGKEESDHLTFGTAFGIGVAHYVATRDRERSLIKAWLAFNENLSTDKKNWWRCMGGLQIAFPALDDILMDYDVVYYKDKPAAELSFRLDINEKYYFVGHIDLILRHKATQKFCVFEVKHTGLQLHDLEPLYANSGQALGYSIALDRIVGVQQSSYDVVYFVLQVDKSFSGKIQVLPFKKTILDRLNWFLTLGIDVERIERMRELNVFPKRGASCLRFNRPCIHFGTCGLSSFDKPKEPEEDKIVYDFIYDLDSLVTDHLVRVKQMRNQSTSLLGA
jgi:hypothetical protein